jgi:hypothetical protein
MDSSEKNAKRVRRLGPRLKNGGGAYSIAQSSGARRVRLAAVRIW